MSPHNRTRFLFRIDHLSEATINFFGWYEVDRKGSVAVYRRIHDGEEQYVHDGPPRYFCSDDYNDAVAMSDGSIVIGPENDEGEC